MKNILIALSIATWSLTSVQVAHATETKRVCIDQKDAKTGKTKEVCKTVKVHKKLDGTPVPDKKK